MQKETIDEYTSITASKTGKWIVSKDNVDNKHVSGYYLDEVGFRIYHRKDITEGVGPFLGAADQTIAQGQELYDYYQGLNNFK